MDYEALCCVLTLFDTAPLKMDLVMPTLGYNSHMNLNYGTDLQRYFVTYLLQKSMEAGYLNSN